MKELTWPTAIEWIKPGDVISGGVEKFMVASKDGPCNQCGATGEVFDDRGMLVPCRYCEGSGIFTYQKAERLMAENAKTLMDATEDVLFT